jgi:hypothetical protein
MSESNGKIPLNVMKTIQKQNKKYCPIAVLQVELTQKKMEELL